MEPGRFLAIKPIDPNPPDRVDEGPDLNPPDRVDVKFDPNPPDRIDVKCEPNPHECIDGEKAQVVCFTFFVVVLVMLFSLSRFL